MPCVLHSSIVLPPLCLFTVCCYGHKSQELRRARLRVLTSSSSNFIGDKCDSTTFFSTVRLKALDATAMCVRGHAGVFVCYGSCWCRSGSMHPTCTDTTEHSDSILRTHTREHLNPVSPPAHLMIASAPPPRVVKPAWARTC